MILHLLVLIVSTLAGAVAAISGFGIGSLLTPLFALRYGTELAVAWFPCLIWSVLQHDS
jgi:hypothetical protein